MTTYDFDFPLDGHRDERQRLDRGLLVKRSWVQPLRQVLAHRMLVRGSDIGDRPYHSHKDQWLKRVSLQSFQSRAVKSSSIPRSNLSRDCHPLFYHELYSKGR